MGGRSSEYLKLVTPIKDSVLPLVEAHPAYKDLKATIDRSIASTYDGKTGVETQEYLKKYMQSPESYLTNLPLNVKSGSGKKIEELQGQIRRELNLPKEGVGTYRSNNIDWNKMIIDEQAKPSTPKSESTSSKSPTQMTKDEYIASISKVVAMSLSTSKLKNGRYARLKDKISGLEDKGSASIGSKNSMVLMPDTQENRDYIKGIGGSVSRDQGLANGANQFPESIHRQLVATALKKGEDLPKAVLADYPDLVARQKAAIDKFN